VAVLGAGSSGVAPSTWARSPFVRPRKPAPLDASVDYEGDGPLAPEVADNDDPSPGVP
jgi:hypothetical protein